MADSYPPDWERRRKKVYERDDHVCQNCGAESGERGHIDLHAHHIVPVSKGGSHELSNLAAICNQCHKAIHNKNEVARTQPSQSVDINPDEYEGIRKGVILFSKTNESLNGPSGVLSDAAHNLDDYLQKMFKYNEEAPVTVQSKLSDAYISAWNDYEQGLSDYRSLLIKMKEVRERFEFKTKTKEVMQDYIESRESLLEAWREALEGFGKIASIEDDSVLLLVDTSESVEYHVNLQIDFDNVSDAQKMVKRTMEEVTSQLDIEVEYSTD